ncbi:MAG TPA: pyrimidine dimer DNA glycosylase/endonuclease V [Gemmatimonadaceae bacterium]|nr:pyrimidine dimer DNA glycosylase/endonuclease V [Gemmatimonadaceae bacterium]
MRLWSIHPRYLDAAGLVALWREALLAQAVLRGATRGYRHHPQLQRFQAMPAPAASIAEYLRSVHAEAERRGYSFAAEKIGVPRDQAPITVTSGQLACEWTHLLAKLKARSPERHAELAGVADAEAHPLFRVVSGPVEPWERAAP